MIFNTVNNKQIIVVIFFIVLLQTACSTTPSKPIGNISMQTAFDDDTAAWRRCNFRVAWPEGSEPDWGVDLLLAHKLFGPVLHKYGNNIYRWRFHRRANRDSAGHQFSFIYYAGSRQANDFVQHVEKNDLWDKLLKNNILDVAECEKSEIISRPEISDSSDNYWSDSVQRQWPSYIMGVSNLWLGLIDDAIALVGTDTADMNMLVQQYTEANQIVTDIWQNEGEHAFLHHLNAIFGYEKILIQY